MISIISTDVRPIGYSKRFRNLVSQTAWRLGPYMRSWCFKTIHDVWRLSTIQMCRILKEGMGRQWRLVWEGVSDATLVDHSETYNAHNVCPFKTILSSNRPWFFSEAVHSTLLLFWQTWQILFLEYRGFISHPALSWSLWVVGYIIIIIVILPLLILNVVQLTTHYCSNACTWVLNLE